MQKKYLLKKADSGEYTCRKPCKVGMWVAHWVFIIQRKAGKGWVSEAPRSSYEKLIEAQGLLRKSKATCSRKCKRCKHFDSILWIKTLIKTLTVHCHKSRQLTSPKIKDHLIYIVDEILEGSAEEFYSESSRQTLDCEHLHTACSSILLRTLGQSGPVHCHPRGERLFMAAIGHCISYCIDGLDLNICQKFTLGRPGRSRKHGNVWLRESRRSLLLEV